MLDNNSTSTNNGLDGEQFSALLQKAVEYRKANPKQERFSVAPGSTLPSVLRKLRKPEGWVSRSDYRKTQEYRYTLGMARAGFRSQTDCFVFFRIKGCTYSDEKLAEIIKAAFEDFFAKETNANASSNGQATYKTIPILNTVELAKQERTEVRFRIQPYLVVGAMTELDGFLKDGKTTLLLAWTKTFTASGLWSGQPVERCDVVYLTEQSPYTFEPALEVAGLMNNAHLHVMYFYDKLGIPWTEVIRQALIKCEQVQAGVLIVDTLSAFAEIPEDKENHAGTWTEALRPFASAMANGLTVLWSRHEALRGGDTGRSGRGSTQASGISDIILRLKAKDDLPENVRELKWKGRFGINKALIALVDGEYVEQRPTMTDDMDPSKQVNTLREAIESVLGESEQSISEIEKALKAWYGKFKPPSYDTIEREVKRMLADDILTRHGEAYTGFRYSKRQYGTTES
jgi:hypothetical protein